MRLSNELIALLHHLAAAAGLPRPPYAYPARFDWNRWMDLVGEQKFNAFLGARLDKLRDFAMPETIQRELYIRYVRAGYKAGFRTMELSRILSALDGAAETILLKGAALTPALYPTAAERDMWDLDLLFRSRQDQDVARALLERMSYAPSKQFVGHHHLAPMVHPSKLIAVELHMNLITPPIDHNAMAEIWRRRVKAHHVSISNFWVLDPVARLIHHGLHALTDPAGAPVLRNLFEVAWMVNRLKPEEIAEIRELVGRWNVGTLVARSLWLAHDLFGSAPLLDRPKKSAFEFWGLVRIERTDSSSAWSKYKKHLANKHMDEVFAGRGDRNILVPLALVARSLKNAAFVRLRNRWRWPGTPLKRKEMPHARVGDALLLHDEESGEVHLLNEIASKVWLSADGQTSSARIAEALERENIEPALAKEALQTLLSKGLVLR